MFARDSTSPVSPEELGSLLEPVTHLVVVHFAAAAAAVTNARFWHRNYSIAAAGETPRSVALEPAAAIARHSHAPNPYRDSRAQVSMICARGASTSHSHRGPRDCYDASHGDTTAVIAPVAAVAGVESAFV